MAPHRSQHSSTHKDRWTLADVAYLALGIVALACTVVLIVGLMAGGSMAR